MLSDVEVLSRLGLIVHKVYEIIFCKQYQWLEKNISFNTQNRNQAKRNFEKDFNKLLHNAFYGKTMEKIRYKITIIPIKKDEDNKKFQWQSTLKFNGTQKSYENFDKYTFEQNEVLMGNQFI